MNQDEIPSTTLDDSVSETGEENSPTTQIPDPSSSNRMEEELGNIGQSQLDSLRRERELLDRTAQALRKESEERTNEFQRLVESDRRMRRNDGWWADLMQRQPEMTDRVRRVCEMWSSPKKVIEAKRLLSQLKKRREYLAMARAHLIVEMKPDEVVDDGQTRTVREFGLQNEENEETGNEDVTVYEPVAGSSQQQPLISDMPNAYYQIQRQPPRPTRAPAAANRGQMDADFQLALAIQRAEMQAIRNQAPMQTGAGPSNETTGNSERGQESDDGPQGFE